MDFVVYGESGFWAVEVKNARYIRSRDLYGLNAFREDYPQAQALFLYGGLEKLKIGDVLCLPCADFLSGLLPGKPLVQGA